MILCLIDQNYKLIFKCIFSELVFNDYLLNKISKITSAFENRHNEALSAQSLQYHEI